MKTLAISSIIAALALIGAAPQAEARPRRGYPATTIVVRGYTSYGAPIRVERYFVRYNSCGSVIWGYRPLPVRAYCPPPRPYCPPPRPYCPPPRGYYGRPAYDRGCR